VYIHTYIHTYIHKYIHTIAPCPSISPLPNSIQLLEKQRAPARGADGRSPPPPAAPLDVLDQAGVVEARAVLAAGAERAHLGVVGREAVQANDACCGVCVCVCVCIAWNEWRVNTFGSEG